MAHRKMKQTPKRRTTQQPDAVVEVIAPSRPTSTAVRGRAGASKGGASRKASAGGAAGTKTAGAMAGVAAGSRRGGSSRRARARRKGSATAR